MHDKPGQSQSFHKMTNHRSGSALRIILNSSHDKEFVEDKTRTLEMEKRLQLKQPLNKGGGKSPSMVISESVLSYFSKKG